MATRPQVKRIFLFLLLALLTGAGRAQAPDAQDILRTVRMAQAGEHRVLDGRLRTGSQTVPLRLVLDGAVIRYEFTNPDEAIVVCLGEDDARLDESTAAGTRRVSLAKLDDKVRGSNLTYEDVSLRFLYWKNAAVTGDETIFTRPCWRMELHPGRGDATQYGTVRAWIEKESGALLRAECFARDGRLAMRFTLKSVQRDKTDDRVWIPKSLRIERMDGDKTRDKTPTYLELEARTP